MIGIGANLLRRVRSALRACNCFDSKDALQALFVDDRIVHWKLQIPEARSTMQRVDTTIAYLCTEYNEQQENALVLFLMVLAESFDVSDANHQTLLNLANELEQSDYITQLAGEVKRKKLDQAGIKFPIWLKILLPISLLTLGMLSLLLIKNLHPPNSDANIYPTPDANRLRVLSPVDLDILKMTLAYTGTTSKQLWIAARSSTTPQTIDLYRLAFPWDEKSTLELVYQTSGKAIRDMLVDCRGNVWLALEEPSGVRVYNPQDGADSFWLDMETTSNWLERNTVYALASRCLEDRSVEVWLGRRGVHTLRYKQVYPSLQDVILIPHTADPIYSLTENLTEVRDLYYDQNAETLWGINNTPPILMQIPFVGLRTPHTITIESLYPRALRGGANHGVWIAGADRLTFIEPTDEQVVYESNSFDTLGVISHPGREEIWLGARCDELTSCSPLTWWCSETATFTSITLSGRKEVRSIVIDTQSVVWIGTENGLVYYLEK